VTTKRLQLHDPFTFLLDETIAAADASTRLYGTFSQVKSLRPLTTGLSHNNPLLLSALKESPALLEALDTFDEFVAKYRTLIEASEAVYQRSNKEERRQAVRNRITFMELKLARLESLRFGITSAHCALQAHFLALCDSGLAQIAHEFTDAETLLESLEALRTEYFESSDTATLHEYLKLAKSLKESGYHDKELRIGSGAEAHDSVYSRIESCELELEVALMMKELV
jgi:hypothetical protein